MLNNRGVIDVCVKRIRNKTLNGWFMKNVLVSGATGSLKRSNEP